MGSRTSYRQALILIILVIFAALTSGFAVGWTVGYAGLDSAVLAAVLPVILTGIAGGAGAVAIKSVSGWRWRKITGESSAAEWRLVVLAAGTVISFSTAFLFGTFVGAHGHEEARNKNADQAVAAAVRLEEIRVGQRHEYLVRCTDELVRLNSLREKANVASNSNLNLEPLTIGQVCVGLVLPAPSKNPLLALIHDDGFSRLLSDTEKEHYEYIEKCTLDQAAAQAAANSTPGAHASVTIGQVCPALGVPGSALR